MRRYKFWLISSVVAASVVFAWYDELHLDNNVNVHDLNVQVNVVEQAMSVGSGNLEEILKDAHAMLGLNVNLLDDEELIKVPLQTNRTRIVKEVQSNQLPNGLYTFRGIDFYVVPINTGQRLAFYGQSPAINQLHFMDLSTGTLLLSFVILAVAVFWLLDIKRFSNFKHRLNYVLGAGAKEALIHANQESTYRYVVYRFSELGQELVEQQYSHEFESTKQDERMRNMMHDMKTPIAALHAFVEAYEDGLYTSDQLPGKMSLVVRNVSHLIHLTDQYDNYLKYASWTTKANMRRYALDYIIQEILMGIERDFVAIGRTIQLVLMESPAFLVCDITELKKLLHILVENAHKYSEKDKPIILSAMVRLGMLYIAVKDYGIGIAPDQHSVIFDPFVKVDKARGASAKSYGIGLYIAKQIAIHHGGDITLDSSLENGATFTLILPVAER